MADFWFNQNETSVGIPSTEEIGSITYYKIKVNVGEVFWIVTHRYSEFFNLHNQLVSDHGVSKDILPSKKVIRNKCPIFIESRRKGLEEYLQKILNFLQRTMPRIFSEFLDFHLYDIFFLLQDLAFKFSVEADLILNSSQSYTVSPLELHAVSECLKKPFPALDNANKQCDFGHILDFFSQLTTLIVNGRTTPFLKSNIIPNKLSYEFSSLKGLKSLHLNGTMLNMVVSLGSLRNTLINLNVHGTNITNVNQVLQCDVIHKYNLEGSEKWTSLKKLDLSNNNLMEIDKTISLAVNLKTLILNNNKICTLSNLSELPKLSFLSLSNNLISNCSHLHTKVGNIMTLILSQNSIVSLKGFEKLYSLETLDLSCNKITDVEEITYIGDLPCLESLVLTGNCLATTVDYRIKVLQFFGEKAKDICLDNEKPSQSEIDKVSILRALRFVKEGKVPNLATSFA